MSQLTLRFSEAFEYARAAHEGQVRKGSSIPYLYHLMAVSGLVLEYGGTEDQAIAGLLHDVLEDCGEHHSDEISHRFGAAVLAIVKDCTDGTASEKAAAQTPDEKRASWWKRKLAYVDHLRKEPDASLLVSGCDKLHNALAILGDLEDPSVGPAVFDRFTGGMDGTLRYYASIAALLDERTAPMARRFGEVVDRMHALAGAPSKLPLDHEVYWLKVYDNFHYMDESETYRIGPYFGASEALMTAKALVDETIDAALSEGGSPEDALAQYRASGEDPMIIGSPQVQFSGWSYAKARCAAT